MPLFLKRRIYKPFAGRPYVNFNHPLGHKMVAAWIFNEGSGNTTAELISGLLGTLNGSDSVSTPIWAPSDYGTTVQLRGGVNDSLAVSNIQYSTIPPMIANLFNGDATIVFRGLRSPDPNNDPNRSFCTSSQWAIRPDSTPTIKLNIPRQNFDQTNSTIAGPSKNVLGGSWGFFTLVVTWKYTTNMDNAGVSMYVDGTRYPQLSGSFTNEVQNQIDDSAGTFKIGTGGGGTSWLGPITNFYIYKRTLSGMEAAWISNEPFAPIEYSINKSYYFFYAGASTTSGAAAAIINNPVVF